MRDHYKAAAIQGSVGAQIELDGLPLPAPARHVMRWFAELHSARGSSGWGPNPIGHRDILAWSELTGQRPLPHELEWLLELDRTFLRVQAEKPK